MACLINEVADKLIKFFRYTNIMQKCTQSAANTRAVDYCGTRSSGGVCQLEILKSQGMVSNSYLLEVGCGPLMMGIPAMTYLDNGHYVGIEPNGWIIEQTLSVPENNKIFTNRNPTILSTTDFDARSLDIEFDYVFAHSIMSHASANQLPMFLERCSDVLKPGGILIFSIRLTTPNQWGGEGAPEETNSSSWVYPGCSFFHKETVETHAHNFFDSIRLAPEFTEMLTRDCKGVCHDWFIARK